VLTEPLTGRLSSIVSEEFGVGSAQCPWIVRGPSGQHIILSGRYFHREYPEPLTGTAIGAMKGGGGDGKRVPCLLDLMTITDGRDAKRLTVCDLQVNFLAYRNIAI